MFYECTNEEGTIDSEADWIILIDNLTRNQLVSLKDTRRMEEVKPSFPLTFQTLVSTICQAFGDASVKQLNSYLVESKEQLENCRTYINMVNIKSLSADELFQLASILYHCKT